MIDFKNGSIFKLSQVKANSIEKDIAPLLISNERIIGAYKGVRDFVVFTNKRIICVNVQGITGKKKDYTSLPYSKVQAFSVETAGHFDFDSELDLYYSSLGHVRFEFTGTSDVVQIGKTIGEFIL